MVWLSHSSVDWYFILCALLLKNLMFAPWRLGNRLRNKMATEDEVPSMLQAWKALAGKDSEYIHGNTYAAVYSILFDAERYLGSLGNSLGS